jgi:hypothetical protein
MLFVYWLVQGGLIVMNESASTGRYLGRDFAKTEITERPRSPVRGRRLLEGEMVFDILDSPLPFSAAISDHAQRLFPATNRKECHNPVSQYLC